MSPRAGPRRDRDPDFWRDQAPAPRIAADGIRARSKRGPIGAQWWSRRFTGVLESWGMAGRLARGRNYARAGQVLGFDISPGYVTAQVQGSRPKPYRVRIQVLPLTTPQWQRVTEELAAQALFRAGLLAGEMPPEIEEVFAACGTPLFPRSSRDMEMSCSCPDWEVPCKHLAAVCYVLAEAFDDDPFAILAWRGRDREELLANLHALRAGASSAAGPASGTGPDSVAGASAGSAAGPRFAGAAGVPLADCLDSYFAAPAPLPVTSQGVTSSAALLEQLPEVTIAVRGRPLTELLLHAYLAFGERPAPAGPAGPDGPPGEPEVISVKQS
jgi:uncharacterized Zn finger protein